MLYPLLLRTLLPFTVVLVLHGVILWLLVKPTQQHETVKPPKVLMASFVPSPKPITTQNTKAKPVPEPKLIPEPKTKPKPEPKPKPKPKPKQKPKPIKMKDPLPKPKPEPEPLPISGPTPKLQQQPKHELEVEKAASIESASPKDTESNENQATQEQNQAFTAIKVDAQSSQNHPPVYPKLSKRLKEEGTVLLTMLISAEGKITDISVKESSGFKRLDNAALTAAKKWQYQPATLNGKAIAQRYFMPIEFKLNTSKR